jgi:hypothetical protein
MEMTRALEGERIGVCPFVRPGLWVGCEEKYRGSGYICIMGGRKGDAQ